MVMGSFVGDFVFAGGGGGGFFGICQFFYIMLKTLGRNFLIYSIR